SLLAEKALRTEPQDQYRNEEHRNLGDDLGREQRENGFASADEEASEQRAAEDLPDATDDDNKEGADEKNVADIGIDAQHRREKRSRKPRHGAAETEDHLICRGDVETEQTRHLAILNQ